MSELQKHLQVLELPPSANWDEVTRAYRELIKIWHPDRFGHDEQLRTRAESKSKELNEAIRQLRRHYRRTSVFRRPDLDGAPKRNDMSGVSRGGTWESYEKVQSRNRASHTFRRPTTSREFRGAGVHAVYENLQRKNEALKTLRFLATLMIVVTGALVVAVVGLPQAFLSIEARPRYEAPLRPLNDYRVVSTTAPEKPSEPPHEIWMPAEKPSLVEKAANCNLAGIASALNGGADVNEADRNGDSALAWAARTNCLSGAKMLLDRGASRTTVARNGFTPKDWAKWTKDRKMIDLLLGR